MDEFEEVVEKRKENVLSVLKNPCVWVIGFLVIALILGIYIRSMPMHDHGGKPGLWDITTGTWTLGPDLDPWLFTRYAKTIVEQGGLPVVDEMRYSPRGYEPAKETRLLPYMIAYTYKLSGGFLDNVEHAAVIFPVIMFALTILSFFLFVREIFRRKSKRNATRANIIALISTFFMIVIPIFLSRTVAGIPEKESAAFFFMFLAFYLFLRAWKSDKLKWAVILGILAGIATAMMGLISGLVVYVFVSIAVSVFLAFILNKVHKKEFIIYLLWILFSFSFMLLFSDRFSLKGFITSLDTGLAFMVLFILVIHFTLWHTKISKTRILQNRKIPKNIISLIAVIIFGILSASILFGPGFIIEKLKDVNQIFFKPVTGRWITTVAENRQPFFTEWRASFGPFIKNIPILFWLFFIGSVVLFRKMLNYIKRKDAWILTGLYILFFLGLVFSRYSSGSMFNGENFISKAFYYLSALLLIGYLIYCYIKYHKEGYTGFKKIRFEYLLLFSLFVLCLFTARSAVRLIMVLGPIAPIFVGFLIVECFISWRKSNEESKKILLGAFFIIVVLLSLFAFQSFYSSVKGQAYSFIPGPYNQQWQKAMQWVREETSVETTVFAHWWDYGYWVQSIGERATVLDGSNSFAYWNYLMGRLVLTGDNQKDALDFLYSHNATHLLIDSTDIGKYGAFSSIGSDKNYDRYSWIPTMAVDSQQTRETADGTIRIYPSGAVIDEDLTYEQNETKIFLPSGKAGIGAIVLKTMQDNNSISFEQPGIIFIYNGKQYNLPLRYLHFNGQFIDFGNGIKGTARILSQIQQSSQGISIDEMGTLIYISPRVMRGMFAQKYLLNDPFNNFPNFKLVHSESDLIIGNLKSQGFGLNEFVYFGGVRGPIKIWKISYNGDEQIKEEYLDTNASKYLDWEL